jgi:hypothetical protein
MKFSLSVNILQSTPRIIVMLSLGREWWPQSYKFDHKSTIIFTCSPGNVIMEYCKKVQEMHFCQLTLTLLRLRSKNKNWNVANTCTVKQEHFVAANFHESRIADIFAIFLGQFFECWENHFSSLFCHYPSWPVSWFMLCSEVYSLTHVSTPDEHPKASTLPIANVPHYYLRFVSYRTVLTPWGNTEWTAVRPFVCITRGSYCVVSYWASGRIVQGLPYVCIVLYRSRFVSYRTVLYSPRKYANRIHDCMYCSIVAWIYNTINIQLRNAHFLLQIWCNSIESGYIFGKQTKHLENIDVFQ